MKNTLMRTTLAFVGFSLLSACSESDAKKTSTLSHSGHEEPLEPYVDQITSVSFGNGTEHLGYFKIVDVYPRSKPKWTETGKDLNHVRFNFIEEGRDDKSIILKDDSRKIKIVLNFNSGMITLLQAGLAADLYKITGNSKNEISNNCPLNVGINECEASMNKLAGTLKTSTDGNRIGFEKLENGTQFEECIWEKSGEEIGYDQFGYMSWDKWLETSDGRSAIISCERFK